MLEAQEMLRKWEAKDPEVYSLWETMNGWVYEGFDVTYKALGVDFDKIYYESQTYLLGKSLVEEGLRKGVFYRRDDNSVWIDLTADGLDDFFFIVWEYNVFYTPRQVMVYEARGAPVPTFAHISMILGADGKKLSKRHGATSVEEYRDAGYLSDAFVNYLALLGWSLDGETTIIPRDVLASKFSLDRISKNPATFDPKKLDWVNVEYINGMSDAQFADEIMVPELHESGLIEGNVEYGEDWIDALAAIVKPRTKMPADAVTVAAPIFATAETLEYDEKSVNKGLAKEGMGAILDAAKAALEGVNEWTAANIDAALEPLPEQMDLKKRVVFQAVRVAVCGNMVSPPLGETMALVGRDDCLARIDRARTMAL